LQTATALGKLGHPDGELNLTRAAGKHGVVQMVREFLFVPRPLFQSTFQIPTLASCGFDEIVDAAQPGQPQWMQL
jgi:L-lactate dehydrogenase (cytochrome)